MAIDGVGITMSRTGLLDIFIMVLALGAFSLLLMHRDWAKARLGRAADPGARPPQIAVSWYRIGAAVLLGLATGVKWSGTYFMAVFCVTSVLWDAWMRTGVKWSGTYFMAVFCVTSVLWDAWMRHQAGYRRWFITGVLRDGAVAACTMLPAYALTYLATWSGSYLHPDSYMHDWARLHPGEGIQWLPESWRWFVQYHAQMCQFHNTLDAPHTTRSTRHMARRLRLHAGAVPARLRVLLSDLDGDARALRVLAEPHMARVKEQSRPATGRDTIDSS